jgi:large subunit ribosomal protein L4
MKTDVYNIQGKKKGTIDLPETIFGVAWNDSLMHQVVTSMQANARTPVAHVKERGEVRGGGKKPWRQKGTGRARHGSTRSPIWIGGGVTHGPRNEKNYARAIPKQMRAKALFMALSRKFKDGEVMFVDAFGFSAPKTAEAKKALAALAGVQGFERLSARHNAAFIAMPEASEATVKSFRNIGSIGIGKIADLNPVSVLKYKYLIIEAPESALGTIAKRLTRKTRLSSSGQEATTEGSGKKSKKKVTTT